MAQVWNQESTNVSYVCVECLRGYKYVRTVRSACINAEHVTMALCAALCRVTMHEYSIIPTCVHH